MLNRLRTIRKRWLFASGAAALLAVGLIAGSVVASGGPPLYPGAGAGHDTKGHAGAGLHDDMQQQLLQRVAEILDIEEAALTDAFNTALNELADAEFQSVMAALVEDETLTQEQADGANTWFAARPADAGHFAFLGVAIDDADKLNKMLTRLVEREALTQETADAIAAWHADRPDYLPDHLHDGDHDGRHGRHGDDDSGS